MQRRVVWMMVAVCAQAAAQSPPTYTLTEITGLPPGDVGAYDLDNRGRVLLGVRDAQGVDRPFLWEQGEIHELPVLEGAERGIARAMSETGLFAGSCGPWFELTATIWRDQTPEPVPVLNGGLSDIMCLSPGGDWCGYARAFPGQGVWHGFAVIDGQTHDLGPMPFYDLSAAALINDYGVVAGAWSSAQARTVPFVWDPGHGIRELPTLGGLDADVLGINNQGVIVGWSSRGVRDAGAPIQAQVPVIWDAAGRVRALPTAPGLTRGMARSINTAGLVVGRLSDPALQQAKAVIWIDGTLHMLDDLTDLPGPGWTVSGALEVNDHGVILAVATLNGQGRPVLLHPK